MKKIFTFCAAVLASVSLTWAQTTIFSAQAIVTSDVTIAKGTTDQEVTAEQATITGGSMYVTNGETSDKKLIVKSAGSSGDKKVAFALTNSKTWFKVVLSQALAEGDVISANVYAGSDKDGEEGLWFSVDAARPGAAPDIKADGATAGAWSDVSYIVAANDDLNGKTTFYIHRATGTTTNFVDFTIVRPVQKEVDHVDITLGGVAVNGEALSGTQMATLYGAFSLDLTAEFVEAPTVTFTVQTDTYYVGEETPSTKSENIDVVAALNPDGKWQAQQTVGEQTYTITAVKPATVTITYMDGATVLGEEIVKVGELSTKHANFETKPLAKFEGWFEDAELTVPADLTAAVNADKILYGKFVKSYISANVNIEQLVLDYGTSYDIQSALTAAGWSFENLNSLDTLNDLDNKTNRNYDFLGLKLKTAGAYIQGWCRANEGFIIKFGNFGSDIKVTVTGATTNVEQTFAKADLWSEDDQAYVFLNMGFPEEVLVKISTVSGSTVVLKQLMLLDEGIQVVTLPAPSAYLITIAESENGTVTAEWANKKYRTPVGETVTLTVNPAEGYKLETITVNEVALEAVEDVYSFVMPAQEVTVSATFEVDPASAISNTNANVKAVKVVRNGQLFIEKNGVLYNAQGAIVK